MDQNLPIVAKKVWNIVRVLYLVLRKEISKRKLLLDLNFTLNKAKLADKLAALQNLMFHHIYHHHHHHTAAATNHHVSDVPLKKYKVQSGDHPIFQFHLPFDLKKRKSHHAPPPPTEDDVFMEAFQDIYHSAAASPAFPGFRPSPMVRQVRITDSPYPLISDVNQESNVSVNEAAEEFIVKFYKKLRQQNGMSY